MCVCLCLPLGLLVWPLVHFGRADSAFEARQKLTALPFFQSVNLSTNPSINHSIWICQSVYVCVSVFPSDLLAWPPVHFLAGLTQHLKRIRSLQLLLSPDLGLKAVSIFARARRVLLQPLIRFGRGLLVVVFETRISTHGLVAMTSAQHAEGRQLDPGWVYSATSLTSSRTRRDNCMLQYTQPGSNWRPSACEADVIATRPWVLLPILWRQGLC